MASARSSRKSRPRGDAQVAAQSLLICPTTSLSRGPSLAAPQDFLELCVDFRHHSRAETAQTVRLSVRWSKLNVREGAKSRHRPGPGKTCIDPSKTFGASAFGATAHPC